ncbi:hypothetical protein JMA_37260 (plasmid) [Jeotgalibacillus malaysiensis]|uniref:Uncharacterized protein n=1 Tax=Jeotgalibacillus malaysiensis TaxID=1508404 RepID=A0A0B5AYH2_9BACL|nr:hypothetical protein [Jeotgalibacillus malaysiensis]AJD93044.1 hypothetical protein JMA_37260 [Jeotgalibacillus malaysiensis]
MKIREIIEQVEKSEQTESWVDVNEVAEELGLGYGDYGSPERLSSYYFGSWTSTDETVGYKVYYLDQKPVAISTQTGRKSDEIFYWLSQAVVKEVRSYIISLIKENEDSFRIKIANLEEEIGNGFKIHYYGDINRFKNVSLNETPVEVMKPVPEPYGLGNRVIVQLPDGTEMEVEMNELTFGYFLKEETNTHD